MARYTDAVCKLCRREGQKLFLKGSRCYTSKCALERRSYAPGQHGQSRKRDDCARAQPRRFVGKRHVMRARRQRKRHIHAARAQKLDGAEEAIGELERKLATISAALGNH